MAQERGVELFPAGWPGFTLDRPGVGNGPGTLRTTDRAEPRPTVGPNDLARPARDLHNLSDFASVSRLGR